MSKLPRRSEISDLALYFSSPPHPEFQRLAFCSLLKTLEGVPKILYSAHPQVIYLNVF